MTRVLRHWARILGVTVVLFALAGCAGIPSSGPVEQGSAVAAAGSNSIEFLPEGPVLDGTEEQILRGFIEAASGPQNDYAIAREFLTPEFALAWDPNASVRVDVGSRTISVGTAAATVDINQAATVDALGLYSETPSDAATSLDYSFELIDGQWRISNAPAGVVIDRFTFEQVYGAHSLYFFDPTFSTLVPDLRWFPNSTSVSTRIVKALLAGPAPWLGDGGATVSAYPEGTALVADTVPVTRGVATMDLTAGALEAGTEGLRAMQQQATASLRSVSTVTSVNLVVDGVPQEIIGGGNIEGVLPADVDSRALVLRGDQFGFLNGTAVTPIDKLSSAIVGLSPVAVSLAPAQRMAAVLTDTSVMLVRSVGDPIEIDSRPGLISPTVDNANYVWSVPAQDSTALKAISTDGVSNSVEVPWSDAEGITALKVSRDGARVVALLNDNGVARLYVSAVIRGDRSVPVRLGTPVELTAAGGSPVDVAWVDSFTVISLARAGDSTTAVTQVIGGRSRDMASLTGESVVSVSGANSISQVRALNSAGTMSSLRVSGQWVPSAQEIRVLGTQQ